MTLNGREIIVGVDGTDQSLGALRWAAREAKRRGAPLHLVSAYSVPVYAGSTFDVGYAAFDQGALDDAVKELVREAALHVQNLNVEVRSTVETGDPSGVLLELSKSAQLLVLGSRGRGGLLGRLLGSVSTAVPAHSHCPVGIIPLPWAREHQLERDINETKAFIDGVSVGSDGSKHSSVAMLRAADEAQLLGVPLTVVCAVPPMAGAASWMPTPVDFENIYQEIADALNASVRWLRGHFPDLEINAELLDGSPIDVLVQQSNLNRLVVMGTRGRGGFAGMLLGSTSQGVIHNSAGPLMIIQGFEDERLADRPEVTL